MFQNLIIGCLTMAVCVMIQCFVVGVMLRVLIALDRRSIIQPTLMRTSGLLTVALLILLTGNILQMNLWAILFCICGEFEGYSMAFYHSVVNFSTLGYGDVVMSTKWRLLGALEAANGVLMFGLTTSFLYMILNALIRRAWGQRTGQIRAPENP